MEDIINQQEQEQSFVNDAADIARKKHRLLGEHLITQDQSTKMSDEEVNKEYDKLESKIINGVTKDTTTMASHVYTQLMQRVLPMANFQVVTPENLQKAVNENVFLRRYINRVIPQLYFSGYSNYLLPVSLAISTVPHVQYVAATAAERPPESGTVEEKDFINLIENGQRSGQTLSDSREKIISRETHRASGES